MSHQLEKQWDVSYWTEVAIWHLLCHQYGIILRWKAYYTRMGFPEVAQMLVHVKRPCKVAIIMKEQEFIKFIKSKGKTGEPQQPTLEFAFQKEEKFPKESQRTTVTMGKSVEFITLDDQPLLVNKKC